MLQVKPDCQQGKCEHIRVVRRGMSELWEQHYISSFLSAHTESRFSNIIEYWSTNTYFLPVKLDSLLPVDPVSPLQAESDPLLPACFQRSQIVTDVTVSMSEW